MRTNTRFPMAVHIMIFIAMFQNKEHPGASELMAKSVGTNPVVIRRIVSMLRRAGLVTTRPGVAGAELKKAPEEILLSDIYHAVKAKEDSMIFDLHESPSRICPVGRNILGVLTCPFLEAQGAMEEKLKEYTLSSLVQMIRNEEQIRADHVMQQKGGAFDE